MKDLMYRKEKGLHSISPPDGRADVGGIKRGGEQQTEP